jgi:hypothetical protein
MLVYDVGLAGRGAATWRWLALYFGFGGAPADIACVKMGGFVGQPHRGVRKASVVTYRIAHYVDLTLHTERGSSRRKVIILKLRQ